MTAWLVYLKELKDALRDRRTWLIVIFSSVIAGPLVLLLLSNFISGIEERVAKREVVLAGAQHAPTLVNSLLRAGANIIDAPADYQAQLRNGRLQNAVFEIPSDFETKLAGGEAIVINVVYDDRNDKAQAVVRASARLLMNFNRELGTQRLLARGLSPQLLTAIELDEHDLAPRGARGAQLLFMVPWIALLVAVAGSLSVAIDVTAGERERGSLEPLLMNPVDAHALVLGKWALVTTCAAAIVALTLAGFAGAMALIRNETLSAVMQLGAPQLALFALLVLPFAAMMAAVNMAVATYGRSFKEAQTMVSYVTMLVQIAPLVSLFANLRDAWWPLITPALGQVVVMSRVLQGDPVSWQQTLLPCVTSLLVAAAALMLQSRLLRSEAIVFSRG